MSHASIESWFLRLLVVGFRAQFLAQCYGMYQGSYIMDNDHLTLWMGWQLALMLPHRLVHGEGLSSQPLVVDRVGWEKALVDPIRPVLGTVNEGPGWSGAGKCSSGCRREEHWREEIA